MMDAVPKGRAIESFDGDEGGGRQGAAPEGHVKVCGKLIQTSHLWLIGAVGLVVVILTVVIVVFMVRQPVGA
ncbi:hypothetical protein JCM3774_005481 [Rhodotorula dairenensis]